MAVGGATQADGGFAGAASSGSTQIIVQDAIANLGTLSFVENITGGSVAPGVFGGFGGSANSGSFNLFLFNADVDVGFGQVSSVLTGGDGSNDGGAEGGFASGGSFGINVTDSALDILTTLQVSGITQGGDGGRGGAAFGYSFSPNFAGSNITVAGDLDGDFITRGGDGLGLIANAGGASVNGGTAQGGFMGMSFQGSTLTVNGEVSLNGQFTGGTGQEGSGGDAVAGEIFVGVFGNSVIDAGAFNLTLDSLGGSVLGAVNANGGNTFNGRTTISYDGDISGDTVRFTGDVNITNTAQGGDAGAAGGFGGEGRGGTVELRGFQPGVLAVDGNVNLTSSGIGGVSPNGQGGVGASGFVQTFAPQGGRIEIGGNLIYDITGTGGAGQTGGQGQISTIVLASGGSYFIGGDVTIAAQGTGGDAVDGDVQGRGGDANAGFLDFSSSGNDGNGNTTQIVGNVDIDLSATGGKGSNATSLGNGGDGGNVFGGGIFTGGTGGDGLFEVLGNIDFETMLIAGDGGNGANGGSGGNVFLDAVQVGNFGSPPSRQNAEMVTLFQDFSAKVSGIGGRGGDASAGTGGSGGTSRDGFSFIEARDGLFDANTFSVEFTSTGGDGGFGSTQGIGGDAIGPSTQFFARSFSGTRGEFNINSLSLINTLSAGQGAMPGLEVAGPSLFMEITQGGILDVGTLIISDDGELPPLTGSQFFVGPRSLLVRDGTVNIGDFSVITKANFIFDLIDDTSVIDFNTIDITAGSVDPGPLAGNQATPGVLNASDSLSITTTNGGIDTGISLSTGGDLFLNSSASIFTQDLTGSSIFLTLGAGGVLDTGAVNAPGGLIAIEAVDSLTAPGTVNAASLLLRSLNGNIDANGPIDLQGDFTADAALSVNLEGVTAQSITLNAGLGDIFDTGGLDAIGLVNLSAGGGISLTDVNAGAVTAFTQTGAFAANSLIASNSVGVEASGTITIDDIDARSFELVSNNGFINSTGTLDAEEDARFEALNGSVNITNVAGGTVTGVAGFDLVANGSTTATGTVNLEAIGGGLVVGDVNAGAINLRSLGGDVVAQGGLVSMGLVDILAAGRVFLEGAFVGGLNVQSQAGDISASGNLTADAGISLEASGSIAVLDVNAGSILGRAGDGSITAGNLSASAGAVDLEAFGPIDFLSIDAVSVLLRSLEGAITANGLVDAEEDADIEARNDVNLQMVSAGSLGLRSLVGTVDAAGDITVGGAAAIAGGNGVSLAEVTAGSLDVGADTGDIAINGSATVAGNATFNAGSGAIALGDVTAASITANASDNSAMASLPAGTQTAAQASTQNGINGTISTGSLVANGGQVGLNASGSITFADIAAGSVDVLSDTGDIAGNGPVDAVGNASFTTGGSINLGDVTAGSILAQSRGVSTIGGTWAASNVTINAASIDFGANGLVNAGPNGNVALGAVETAPGEGGNLRVGGSADAMFDGLLLTQDLLQRISGGNVAFATSGPGSSIEIADLDLTAIAGITDATFNATGSIDVVGNVVSTDNLVLSAEEVTLDTETGSINLGTEGTALTVNAQAFIVGDSSILNADGENLSTEDAQALVNTPAANTLEDGVITAGTLVLNVNDVAVIQNVGTEDAPAGFVIGSPDGLVINGNDETGTLVILNGQIADAQGNTTGEDAATAIFATLEDNDTFGIGAGSQINGCSFAGCTAVEEDTGEITSTVSASVNGATASATSSTSGSTTTTGTDSGSSGTTSDAGSSESGGGDSGGEEAGGEEAGASGAPGGVAASGTGSASGGAVTVDTVDDGGGGPGEFDIDSGDSGSSDAGASADAGSDAGSDAGADADVETDVEADAGSDESGSDAETESSSDEGESSSDEGEASDEGETEESDSEESDSEESESEESEEAEDEEESEEEESSEEDEEDSEGPAVGPIAAPPSLINTNTLEQRGLINDPISGSGNPALLDPEVTTTPPAGNGGQ